MTICVAGMMTGHSSCTLCAMPRIGWLGGQSHSGDHRQPERKECGKRARSIDPCCHDAGKRTKGKHRHLLVDTQGLLLCAIVHAADIQDRDGAVRLRARCYVSAGTAPCLSADQHRDRQALRCGQVGPNAGSSNAPSPGSHGAVGWLGTGMPGPHQAHSSCAGLPSASYSEN